jgi:hypothetical protein
MKVWILHDYYCDATLAVFKNKSGVYKYLRDYCKKANWNDIVVNSKTLDEVLHYIGLTFVQHEVR